MTLRYGFGETEVQSITCKDANKKDFDISAADAPTSFVYFLSEDKVEVLLKITNTNFAISSPDIDWTPTKTQAEKLAPGFYSGEAWLKIADKYSRFEFPIVIEKSRQNLTGQDF